MQVHAYCGDMTVEVIASPESESLGKSKMQEWCQPGHVLACRPPAVKDDDDYVAPGQPEIVADIDFAEVCQGEGEKAVRPSWYQPEYGAELMHSQVGSLLCIPRLACSTENYQQSAQQAQLPSSAFSGLHGVATIMLSPRSASSRQRAPTYASHCHALCHVLP